MNDLISIIVPVYNVEKYLDECVCSLVEQTYTNIEIILVDDGSPDNCPAMCDTWAEKDHRIRVIHQKNGGLSAARNAGFKASCGKYIAFIDSDDYINVHMMGHLMELITKTDSDVAICQFRTVPETDVHNIYIKPYGKYYITDGDSLYRALLNNLQNVGSTVWNKLWTRELFVENHITYPEGRVYEDICVVNKLLHYSANVVVSDCELYYNRIRNGSIINSPLTKQKCKDQILAFREIVDDYYSWGVMDIAAKAFSQFCRASIILYQKTYSIPDAANCKQARLYIQEQYHSCWSDYQKKLHLPIYKWLVFYLFRFFPDITSRILKRLLMH